MTTSSPIEKNLIQFNLIPHPNTHTSQLSQVCLANIFAPTIEITHNAPTQMNKQTRTER